MNLDPAISVNIPVYNAVPYLQQTLMSVLAQTFQDFEIVLVDDGSVDNSAEIIESFSDSRIRLYRNDHNRGIAYTRNRLVQLSRGKYIAILDADDVMCRTRLADQFGFLRNNQDFVFIGSDVEIIDGNGKHLDFWRYGHAPEDYPSLLFFKNMFVQSSVMINRSLLPESLNLYDLDYPPAEDYELWCRLARIGKVWNMPSVLTKYRVHESSISRQKSDLMSLQLGKIIASNLNSFNQEVGRIDLHKAFSSSSYLPRDAVSFSVFDRYIAKLKEDNDKVELFHPDHFGAVTDKIWLQVYGYGWRDSLLHFPRFLWKRQPSLGEFFLWSKSCLKK
ncbi:MAG: glycosyltransferase [Imperialibacter sp.]|uniref:glycosyltransferase family 2 protein n=1 Tax=Imperialibacter sp. TaxID=2038411 RepID=UPI0032EECD2A